MKSVIVFAIVLVVSGCSSTGKLSSRESYFEDIKSNTPQLVNFLDKFPKGADLHNHASGASYIEHGLIYAKNNSGYYFDVDALKVVLENYSKPDLTYHAYPDDFSEGNEPKKPKSICEGKMKDSPCLVEISTLLKHPDLASTLKAYLDEVSVRGWHPGTSNGQDHFFDAFNHLYVMNRKNEALAEIIARNYSQGVRYLELMTSVISSRYVSDIVKKLDDGSFEVTNLDSEYGHIKEVISHADFAEKINSSMNKREDAVDAILQEKYSLTIKGETPDIVVRYIPQLYRNRSQHDIFINAAINFKASKLDDRVVATNLVTNEASITSLSEFNAHMAILDYLWNKLDEPNVALHAGELVLRESPVEPMRNRISRSIVDGHASRIGHGVSIAWESDSEGTMTMMRDREVAVEICLSSNDIILGVSGKDHPLMMYKKAGVPLTLATDDEAVSRSNLTMEYVKAAQELDLNYSYLKEIAKNGLKFSFLGGQGIYGEYGEVLPDFVRYLQGALPKVSEVGMKSYLQIRHEIDLREFESSFGE